MRETLKEANLIRSVTQEEAKQHALVQLDQEKCLIIIDGAMKYLPSIIGNRCQSFLANAAGAGMLVQL